LQGREGGGLNWRKGFSMKKAGVVEDYLHLVQDKQLKGQDKAERRGKNRGEPRRRVKFLNSNT